MKLVPRGASWSVAETIQTVWYSAGGIGEFRVKHPTFGAQKDTWKRSMLSCMYWR